MQSSLNSKWPCIYRRQTPLLARVLLFFRVCLGHACPINNVLSGFDEKPVSNYFDGSVINPIRFISFDQTNPDIRLQLQNRTGGHHALGARTLIVPREDERLHRMHFLLLLLLRLLFFLFLLLLFLLLLLLLLLAWAKLISAHRTHPPPPCLRRWLRLDWNRRKKGRRKSCPILPEKSPFSAWNFWKVFRDPGRDPWTQSSPAP